MKLEELLCSLRTFEMNLEEEISDKKEKGIALQVGSYEEESESFYDKDDHVTESIISLTKNFNRVISGLNQSGPMSRNSRGAAPSVQTPRRNTTTNNNNSNACSRNKHRGVNNSDHNLRKKGI